MFGLATPARAQEETPASAETPTEDVIVTAPVVTDMLRSFVGEISNGAQQDQLARWDRTICPGVAGMGREYAEAMLDRIAAIALSIGLDVGEPGCRPNALIFVTADSDALAREIVDYDSALVSRYGRQGNTSGRQALNDFVATPRAVRWWHVTQTVTADGFLVRRGAAVRVRSMGRLRRGTREDFNRVIVVVDARRIEGLRFGAVADYVAMVVLAQLDPEAETEGYTTILNLFGETQARPASITEWDLSYLGGLYGATRDARDAGQQEHEITRQMGEDISEAETAR